MRSGSRNSTAASPLRLHRCHSTKSIRCHCLASRILQSMPDISQDTNQKLIQRFKSFGANPRAGEGDRGVSGLKKLYVDLAIHNPRLDARLLRRLHNMGLIG